MKIIKSKAQIKELENRKWIKINKTKQIVHWQINKIDKFLTTLAKNK